MLSALVGDYPTSYFIFEFIIWTLLLGIPIFILFFLDKIKTHKAWKIIISILLQIGWVLVAYGSFIEPLKLVVHEFDINIKNAPSLRIALLADIHVGPYKDDKWVKKVVDRVNEQNVEIVLIPGDFVFGGAEKYARFLEPLKELKASKKFFTLGNHDHDVSEPRNTEQARAVSMMMQWLGFEELKNESYYWVEKGIWILGIDDNYFEYHDLEKTFAEAGTKPKILLAHSPDIIDEMGDEYSVDLILSGHTHCGQIRLPWVGAMPFMIPTINGKKLEKHWYQRNNQDIFITCGVGEVGPRARLMNPPEIVIINVNPDSKAKSKDCTTFEAGDCPDYCTVCPPCEVCSSISCQSDIFCEGLGIDKGWWDRVRP